jgi:hypothetical protein
MWVLYKLHFVMLQDLSLMKLEVILYFPYNILYNMKNHIIKIFPQRAQAVKTLKILEVSSM